MKKKFLVDPDCAFFFFIRDTEIFYVHMDNINDRVISEAKKLGDTSGKKYYSNTDNIVFVSRKYVENFQNLLEIQDSISSDNLHYDIYNTEDYEEKDTIEFLVNNFNYKLNNRGNEKFFQGAGDVWAYRYEGVDEFFDIVTNEPLYISSPIEISAQDLPQYVLAEASHYAEGYSYASIAKEIIKTVKTNKKEKTMKSTTGNLFSSIGLEFGEYDGDQLAFSPAGVAIKGKSGFVVYDKASKQIIEVGDFKMDVPFFLMPTQLAQLEVGDLLKIEGSFYIFERINTDGSLRCIHPSTGSVSNKIARTNMFGVYFYTKVVSMFNMVSGQQGSINPMMFMLMGKEGGSSNMMEMMVMSQMFAGGGQAPMFNMFQAPQQVIVPTANVVQEVKAPVKKAAKTIKG